MKFRIVAGLAAGMLAGSFAAAVAQPPDPNDCYDGVSDDGPECRANRLEHDDEALDDAFAAAIEVMKTRDSGQGVRMFETTLREAQSAWTAYRESQCQLESLHYYQGSGRAGLYFACMSDLTRSRTLFLKRIPELFD